MGGEEALAREGASGGSLKGSAEPNMSEASHEASDPEGELAYGSEARIRRSGGRIDAGVGTKLRVLTWGGLSASACER